MVELPAPEFKDPWGAEASAARAPWGRGAEFKRYNGDPQVVYLSRRSISLWRSEWCQHRSFNEENDFEVLRSPFYAALATGLPLG